MFDNVDIQLPLSKEESLILLVGQADALIAKEDRNITSLSNFTALVKVMIPYVSWVGFYLSDEDGNLFLGPFQGKPACVSIPYGKGVCGTAAKEKRTMIVADVNSFPGHIACDSASKSEIVIPIIKSDRVVGVLDLDSTDYNSFDELDKKYFQQALSIITERAF